MLLSARPCNYPLPGRIRCVKMYHYHGNVGPSLVAACLIRHQHHAPPPRCFQGLVFQRGQSPPKSSRPSCTPNPPFQGSFQGSDSDPLRVRELCRETPKLHLEGGLSHSAFHSPREMSVTTVQAPIALVCCTQAHPALLPHMNGARDIYPPSPQR